MKKEVKIIGAGLAGSEAAYQLAKRQIKVHLYEQKGVKRHSAFHTDDFAELICSNSLRSDNLENAAGLLKAEMAALDSLIIKSARLNKVEAGSSLAVDRRGFSEYITQTLKNDPYIEIHNEEVTSIDLASPTIIAAGPLCEGKLSQAIKDLIHTDYLYFFDAIAPIIEKDSIDFSKAYYKSRYDEEGEGDYINCPMNKEEFFNFYNELINAKVIEVKDVDKEIYFEGCMPFEVMAKRGIKTLLFGPMKPVGLAKEGIKPYAVVQLRKDNAIDTLYNIVGFQTHLTYGEQKRIIKMIPGLENANIVRYGVMHRNTYINSPKVLNAFYQMKEHPNLFFAGQISGVEGYIESAASGLYAALNMAQYLNDDKMRALGKDTIIGSMAAYIANEALDKLIPMNANFGIFQTSEAINKKQKRQEYVKISLRKIEEYKTQLNGRITF